MAFRTPPLFDAPPGRPRQNIQMKLTSQKLEAWGDRIVTIS